MCHVDIVNSPFANNHNQNIKYYPFVILSCFIAKQQRCFNLPNNCVSSRYRLKLHCDWKCNKSPLLHLHSLPRRSVPSSLSPQLPQSALHFYTAQNLLQHSNWICLEHVVTNNNNVFFKSTSTCFCIFAHMDIVPPMWRLAIRVFEEWQAILSSTGESWLQLATCESLLLHLYKIIQFSCLLHCIIIFHNQHQQVWLA